MKVWALIAVLLFSASLQAQESWQVILNRKTLISSSVSNETKNTRIVKLADWKSTTGYLEIRFREKNPSKWAHFIQLADENENELWKIDSTVAKAKLSTIRKLFNGKKQMKIYMIINPPENIMAPSRRIHLATLKLP